MISPGDNNSDFESKCGQQLTLVMICVAGGFDRAESKVLTAKPREEWGGSGCKTVFLAASSLAVAAPPPNV